MPIWRVRTVTGNALRKSVALSVANWRARLTFRYTRTGGRRAAHLVVAALAIAATILLHASTVASALLEENGKVKVAALAPLGAGWLLWSRREQLRAVALRPWWPGMVLVAMSSTLLILGELAGVNFWRHLALIATLWATVAAVLGFPIARALTLPVLFLLFAANVFFPLEPLLMHVSAQIGVATLRLSGLPSELHGLTIVAPVGSWQITEACSGLEYVLIFAMAATLYASLAFESRPRKVLFVLGAVLAAVLANSLRFWALVDAAYLRDGIDLDHSAIGYVTFSLVFCVLILVGYRLSEPPLERPAPRLRRSAIAPEALRDSAFATMGAISILAATTLTATALEHGTQPQLAFDGCRQIEQSRVLRDGQPVAQTRTQCSGPAGRKQLPEVARALLRQVVPQATLVTGARRLNGEDSASAIDAATLTTLDAAAQYRLTYWYEFGDIATGRWEGLKWHLALALLAKRDATVTVVAELQQIGEDSHQPPNDVSTLVHAQ